MTRSSAPTLLVLAALAGCRAISSPRWLAADPVVVVHAEGGEELGVSTDYGVVFLGRTVQSGRVEFTAWFGDGPSREEGVVESIGGGVYATDAEIELPTVPITFQAPRAGEIVLVRGRRGRTPWETEARVAADPQVEGLLLELDGPLTHLSDDQIGAAVFLWDADGLLRLLGLVSGRLQLSSQDGTREYLTAVGPRDLWRAVVHRRNSDRPRRWVYREDIR